MATSASAVDRQAASWVTRARAGDQNAQAVLVALDRGAKWEAKHNVPPGRRKYKRYYDAAMAAVQAKAPRKWWSVFGRESKPDVTPAKSAPTLSAADARTAESVQRDGKIVVRDPEVSKPELPRGALDGIFDKDAFVRTVVGACKYRNGLDAAAVVLSTGPELDQEQMTLIGMSDFVSDEASEVYFLGVRSPDRADYRTLAAKLAPDMRQCLVVGQCVGRARRIQAIRNPNARLGGAVGWELGE